jgi:hypothetical protein
LPLSLDSLIADISQMHALDPLCAYSSR